MEEKKCDYNPYRTKLRNEIKKEEDRMKFLKANEKYYTKKDIRKQRRKIREALINLKIELIG